MTVESIIKKIRRSEYKNNYTTTEEDDAYDDAIADVLKIIHNSKPIYQIQPRHFINPTHRMSNNFRNAGLVLSPVTDNMCEVPFFIAWIINFLMHIFFLKRL